MRHAAGELRKNSTGISSGPGAYPDFIDRTHSSNSSYPNASSRPSIGRAGSSMPASQAGAAKRLSDMACQSARASVFELYPEAYNEYR